jgi:cyclopropane fatty-acyl-phospholipid synthase-like methyltransferase
MRLRAAFDRVAKLYDSVRPGYPAELVSDLVSLAGIDAGSRVLEIGPGTGQLTVQLVRFGCSMTAVELGPNLAEVARRNLADFPRTEVIAADFEQWPLPTEPFDAVVSATAFHWLAPVSRVARAAAGLRDGGSLAIVDIHHVVGGSVAFFEEEQACAERWWPGALAGPPVREDDVPLDDAEFVKSGMFEPAQFRRYVCDLRFDRITYQARLMTYAGTLAMEPTAREGMLTEIGDIIDRRYDGEVTKRYLYELRVTRKRGQRTARPQTHRFRSN